MVRKNFLVLMVSGLAVAACGSQPAQTPAEQPTAAAEAPALAENIEIPAPGTETQGNDVVAAADTNAAPAAFAQCAVCHTATKDGKNGVGPNLWGVAGGKAAQKAGFAYSDKLKAAALTWDDATLDTWLTNPMKLVPGTKMVFAGQPDAAKRQALIAYLKTLQ